MDGRPNRAAMPLTLPDRPLRRQPYDHEVRAAVDFAGMDLAYQDGVIDTEALLAQDWLPNLAQQAEDAISFTKTGTVRKRLTRLNAAQITIKAPSTEHLIMILSRAAQRGADAAAGELRAQGLDVFPPSADQLTALITDQAQAVAQQVADGVRLAASRRAVQVNNGRTPAEVASEVSNYLNGLAHRWEMDQLRGAVQMATNAGRLAVFALIPSEAPEGFYASELLDTNTCGPCRAIDGYEFPDLDAAHRLYPTGGYLDCSGGPRCRGTVVAVMREDEAPQFPPGLGPG